MPRRIVSLLPAATELVCALGGRGALVGVSHECDFPAGVGQALPAVTSARLTSPHGAGSQAIDDGVRDLLGQALSLYEVDLGVLKVLKPDLIITQDLCEVCAVSTRDLDRALTRTLGYDVEVLSLSPRSLGDLWTDVGRVAQALQRDAGPLLQALQARVERVRERAQGGRAPRLLAIEWLSPVMIAGLWMPELARLAGCAPLGPEAGAKAQTWTRLQLEMMDPAPELILVKPCGFALPQTLAELRLLPAMLPWQRWEAVAAGRVYVADGSAYFNRPGPRLVDSLEILAACAHPERFPEHRLRYGDAVRRVGSDLRVTP